MAEAGDIITEFKHAKTPEKVVIVGAVIGVLGISYYLYRKGSSGSSAPAQGSTSSSGQVAGYPTANGVPVLPNGTNPIYDPNGNLVGYQNPPPAAPPTTPPPAPTNPANWFTALLGQVGYGTHISVGGIDVNGQRFWTDPHSFFYAPPGSKIAYGAQGRVWITPPGGTQQLLTGPGQSLTTIMPKPVVNAQTTQLTRVAAGVNH